MTCLPRGSWARWAANRRLSCSYSAYLCTSSTDRNGSGHLVWARNKKWFSGDGCLPSVWCGQSNDIELSSTRPRFPSSCSWWRGSVVMASVFDWRTFPDTRLIYGWRVTTSWVRRPLWINQPGQLSLLPSVGRGMSSISVVRWVTPLAAVSPSSECLYEGKADVVYLQITLCDPHLST